jgi:SAM-dependent methyltransferase
VGSNFGHLQTEDVAVSLWYFRCCNTPLKRLFLEPLTVRMYALPIAAHGVLMSKEDELANRILKLYQECLQGSPPVASIELIQDSQTSRLLSEIFHGHASPSIIDYGCGSLRLLHALLMMHDQRDWTYLGVDVSDPAVRFPDSYNRLNSLPHRDRWHVQSIATARGEVGRFDVGIIMNVFHELPIKEIAYAFQDMRRLLKPDGVLLIVDTVFLHVGEPRFVPFYPWEIRELTSDPEDKSYRSKSGIPISFYRIPRRGIASFFHFTAKLELMMELKRDYWAHLAVDLSNERARQVLGLGGSKEFDYGYLNTIVANASFRLSEFSRRKKFLRMNSMNALTTLSELSRTHFSARTGARL